MLTYFFLITRISGIIINSIPSTGTPPLGRIGAAGVYDSLTDSIVTIGGQISKNDLVTPDVHLFSLKTLTWTTPKISSEFKPSYFIYSCLFLREDRKIITFGTWAEVLLLRLDDFSWSKSELQGDPVSDILNHGCTSFTFNDTQYLSIFGGMTSREYNNDLFLYFLFRIDVNTLFSRKLPNAGKVPLSRRGPSLTFYNDSLYLYGYSSYTLENRSETGSELFRYDLHEYFWEVIQTSGIPAGPKSYHCACLINDDLFIVYGAMQEYSLLFDTIFKYNFISKTWSFVTSHNSFTVHISASVLIGSKLFMLFGRNLEKIMNSVIFIDLSRTPPSPEYLSNDWPSPSPRTNHCSFTVGQDMFIFAGSDGTNSVTEVFFNDLWTFSFQFQVWSLVKPAGDTPSPRKNFGHVMISGDVLVVFGGFGPSGYLNDLYYFKQSTEKWSKVFYQGEAPSGRSETCMAYFNNELFIVGGRNDEGLSEIWVYSFLTNEFSLFPEKITETGIIDSHCWVEDFSDFHKLVIAGGLNMGGAPNLYLIEIKIFKNSTNDISFFEFSDILRSGLVGSETSLIRNNGFGIRLGGTVFTWMMLNTIFIFDFQKKSLKPFNTSQKFPYFGHSAVHFNKSIYVFGGGGSNDVYKSLGKLTNQFLKIDFEENDEFQLGCSPGTHEDNCQPCQTGTYFKSGSCVKCPIGTFNDRLASTSEDQCLPCPAGYFTNKEGSSKCLQCQSGYSCPVGTITPRRFSSLPLNSSYQPSSYKYKTQKIAQILEDLWTIFGVVLLGFFFTVRVGMVWNFLRKIDLFAADHETVIGEPVIHRKTSFGGLFSVFFLGVSIVMVVGGLLNFFLDNITEMQALIPLTSIETSVKARTLSVEFTLYSYGGTCTLEKQCEASIKLITEGLLYDSSKIDCFSKTDNCFIKVNFMQASLKNKNAGISLFLEEQKSYSNGVSVNISASSSIPDQISGFFIGFPTSNENLLFKGSESSKFYFKFTPSVKISRFSKVKVKNGLKKKLVFIFCYGKNLKKAQKLIKTRKF